MDYFNPRNEVRLGASEAKNGAFRKSMEDFHYFANHFMDPQGAYIGVFDGHAGSDVAQWCALNFHQLLQYNISQFAASRDPWAVLDTTFQQADHLLRTTGVPDSGTTAAVVYITSSASSTLPLVVGSPPLGSAPALRLCTGNIGDTRVVLCTDGFAHRLSNDHVVSSNKSECARVLASGGRIRNERVDGVLSVTRALGDAKLKSYVCSHPYTTETLLDPGHDEFVIVACDGVWDVLTDQEAVDIARPVGDPQLAAHTIVQKALHRGSCDNLTCVVARLSDRFPQPAVPADVSHTMVGNLPRRIGREHDTAYQFEPPSMSRPPTPPFASSYPPESAVPGGFRSSAASYGFDEDDEDDDSSMEIEIPSSPEPRDHIPRRIGFSSQCYGSDLGVPEHSPLSGALEMRFAQLAVQTDGLKGRKQFRYGHRREQRALIFDNSGDDSDAVIDE